MDATQRVACNEILINPLFTMGMQVSCILVLSHFFHLILKPFGQPGPIAQILAGLVLGPSGFSHIKAVRDFFFQELAADYYQTMALFSRILFMFLIGLEMDIPYLMRNLRPASIVAYGGAIMCSIFAAAISPFIYHQTGANGNKFKFVLLFMMILSNTASPVVIRLAAELKFATSDVGRLAISSSLINDMSCLLLLAIVISFQNATLKNRGKLGNGFICPFFIGAAIILNKYLAWWLNRRNRNQKYLKNAEVFGILSIVVVTSMLIEVLGYNSIIACFLLGIMFPREGKTARTLLHKLTYSVHTFILPIYFGYTGFQADLTSLRSFHNIIIVVLIVLLSVGGKVSGTLAACHYLKIPPSEGVVLAFLLNLKGHVDLIVIVMATQNQKWDQSTYNLLLVTVVINTVIVGPVVAFIVRRERRSFAYSHMALEFQNPESELRMLACVHGPRHVSTMVGLVAALSGSKNAPISPYLMHLIELPEKTRTNLMYHQLEDDELSDEEDYGGNDVLEINDAVDTFIAETGVVIHQVKAVSPFASMYEDVCNGAEDTHASIILLPFHKHQRIDGKMENGKEGIRTTNQKVLRHAPCSVAILVDRGLAGSPQVPGSETVPHVATLFFGGPDDREALAYSTRIGMHPRVNLTVIRFLPASSKECNVGIDTASHKDEEILMSISSDETENEVDNAFLADFYNRYVTSGQVGYVEKYVDNGAETATALRDMGDMYSLFIVGKGGRGRSPITTGMSDWEECPELGTVGDVLASSEFEINGSLLVIQQHRHPKKDLIDDE